MQERFPSARVVKSLNQLGYHQLEENLRPKGAPDRIAIGAAGDDRRGRHARSCGSSTGSASTPSTPGRSKNGLALEPDGSPIATTYSADQLAKLVSR